MMFKSHVARGFLVVVLTSLFSLCDLQMHGQAVSVAQISGQVVDSTGAAVRNAEVGMVQTETHYTRDTMTDAQGSYTLPNLPVGPYLLVVTANGFRKYEKKGIVLQVGSNVQINAAMQVGTATESVEVTSEAEGLVETGSNSIAQVINQEQIVQLPLNGRQATQLILVSGASTNVPSSNMISSKNYPSSVAISVAGSQGNGTNYVLDGGDNNDSFSNVNLPFPFPDALQEFSVDTSVLPARNGLHPGGMVNVVTKSGTNQFHGTLFEFLRNGKFNARNYFATLPDTERRNQFGGTAGGPIRKDKLFFFAGYQGTRTTLPLVTTAFVPTAAALNGDFSALESASCQSNNVARTIINPVTKLPYVGAQVPTTSFDPAAVNIMKNMPTTTNSCGKVTYNIPTLGNEDQVIGRADWNPSQKHSLFARYFIVDWRAPAAFFPTNLLVATNPGILERSQTFTIGDTYTITPHLLNSVHFTFNRLRDNRGPAPKTPNAVSYGVKMFNYDSVGMQLTVSNGFATACGTCAPGYFDRNTFQEADDVDWMLGKHQIAFGVNIIRADQNLDSHFNSNGLFSFNGQFTNDPLLDFLLGDMNSFGQSRSQINVYRQTTPGLYVQDSYRVNSRLLINGGLRWEPMLYPQDLFARGNTFTMQDFAANKKSTVYVNAPAGMLFFGDPGVPRSFTNDRKMNFSPRLGLIVNPHGNGMDTIRVGGGLLYDTPEEYYSERLTTNSPYGTQITLTNPGPLSNPWTTYAGGNPYPLPYPPASTDAFPIGGTYAFIPLDLKTPYMVQWNASYERQIAKDWLLTVGYLGNKTTHLWLSLDLNPSVFIPGTCGSSACSTTKNTAQRRVLYLQNAAQGQYYGQVVVTDQGVNANYNGLLTSIQHRLSHGYNLLANYTYSHCISDGDFQGNVGNVQYQNQAIPAGRNADRGNCDFDIRHLVNVSFVGISPGFGNPLVGRIVRGWQFAPLLRVASGLPVIVKTGTDNSLTGDGMDRPDAVSGVARYASSLGPNHQWLNPAAVKANGLGTFGNLSRDAYRAPAQFNLDLSLGRSFPIFRERYQMEVRADAFNSINHPNYLLPSATQTSSSYGRITSANDPRIFQFSMKLHY
jgi:hypothetical protein